MVTDPFDEAAGDCPFEDPQLPQPHLLAVLTALGSNLRLDTHSISRRTCEAVGIYKSAKTKRNEAKHIRRCLAHLESIDDAARHLSNLIEGRGNRELVADGLMSITIADPMQDDPFEAAMRLAASARAIRRDVRSVRDISQPIAAQSLATNEFLIKLVNIYETATGRRATVTYRPKSGEATGKFLDFIEAATAGQMVEQFAPNAIRMRLSRLRKAQSLIEKRAVAHSPTATDCVNVLASEEMPNAQDKRPSKRNDRGRSRARSGKATARPAQS